MYTINYFDYIAFGFVDLWELDFEVFTLYANNRDSKNYKQFLEKLNSDEGKKNNEINILRKFLSLVSIIDL